MFKRTSAAKRRSFLTGLAVGALAAAFLAMLGGFLFTRSGIYDIGAAKPHTDFTEWLTHGTMIQSVRRHAKAVQAPERFTAQQVVQGFCVYETHCVACHGAAGVANQTWANGMEPSPPYLLDAPRRWSRAELFWIVSNGIKMTGMPAWNRSLSNGQMWDVVAYLEATNQAPPQMFARWRAQRVCVAAPLGLGR